MPYNTIMLNISEYISELKKKTDSKQGSLNVQCKDYYLVKLHKLKSA